MANIYEERARLAKAIKLADVLTPLVQEYDVPPEQFTPDIWGEAATRAGTHWPSAATRRLVVSMIHDRLSNADPFARFER